MVAHVVAADCEIEDGRAEPTEPVGTCAEVGKPKVIVTVLVAQNSSDFENGCG